MLIKVFDKEVDIKDTSCGRNGCEGYPYETLSTNFYTCLTHVCNVNCPFCEYHYSDTCEFDFEKWQYCVDEVIDKIGIYKASFTGGEPSLQLNILIKCLDYLKSKDKNIFTIINTNGSHLSELECIDSLDNIAMSRHHYLDDVNNEIFRSNLLPSSDNIINFSDKNKLHLSCNLIKGYIDSDIEIKKYLEWCSTVGVDDVGFVSLMKVNDYCNNHSLDFSDIDFNFNKHFIVNQYFDRIKNGKCVCKCRNYLYLAKNGKFVTVYSRYYVDNTCNDGALVFMDNHLREGFSGNIIS